MSLLGRVEFALQMVRVKKKKKTPVQKNKILITRVYLKFLKRKS